MSRYEARCLSHERFSREPMPNVKSRANLDLRIRAMQPREQSVSLIHDWSLDDDSICLPTICWLEERSRLRLTGNHSVGWRRPALELILTAPFATRLIK